MTGLKGEELYWKIPYDLYGEGKGILAGYEGSIISD
jgi:hypothetical protein